MSLDSSLFVSDQIHERTVTLPDGSVHVLHFRELSATDFRAFHAAEKSDNEEKHTGSMAKLIASSLCEADGKPALSYAKAKQLKAAAANALVQEILAVNGFGEKGNGLQPKVTSGSGTSLPSPSEAAPSENSNPA